MSEDTKTLNINPDESIDLPIGGHIAKDITPETAAVATKKKTVAKSKNKKKDGIHTLSSGIRVKFHPVAANAIREAQARIPEAQMGTFTNPSTGLEEPNPASPTYQTAKAEVTELRTQAAMNTMLLFGLELVDPIPEDNEWLGRLHFINLVSDDEYTEATRVDGPPFMRELLYKKFVVSDAEVVTKIANMSGVTQEMIARARDSFRGDA